MTTDVVVVVVGLEIGDYPNITDTNQCGIGRQSHLLNDQCFEWHKSNDLMSNVVNGRDVQPGEYPYVVYIEIWVRLSKWGGTDGQNECTGSILNQHWILSAAHCYSNLAGIDYYKVFAGTIDKSKLGTDYGVEEVILHPKFERTPRNPYDVALIRVKTPMVFNVGDNGYAYRQLNSICLPPIDHMVTEYELALIVGFGRINDTYVSTNRLQTGLVRISTQNLTDPNIINAYQYPYPGGAHICFGDSGGPLLQYVNGRAVLIGVSIWGDIGENICSPNHRVWTAFVKVSAVLDWIIENISK
ncbi:plasma kallikrein-like [Oppia nitens]|uniref:plasma kallikrein-like n=1 Tax=Oppia nitens TaxID=1686743 RepID=UPI0023D9D3A6|nr:plasma kallikrein-like [Oppia nitens]